MKIQGSVRQTFGEQQDLNKVLLTHVDPLMRSIKRTRWHYEARLKSLESFAAKLETCRVSKPRALEDFLACMIVVPSVSEIAEAVSEVGKAFQIRTRRPPVPGETKKAADSFPFDDIRLYCTRLTDSTLPKEPIDTLTFEVQVKTFLQHAWGLATHDLSYKTDEVSWGKDRVVAHLKAALEQVELSIQEARALSLSPSVNLKSPQTDLTAAIIQVLTKHWARADLPGNLRGLAESIGQLVKAIGVAAEELDVLLTHLEETAGGLPINLSPYGVVIMALLGEKQAEVDKALVKSRRPLVFLTPELDLPAGFPSAKAGKGTVRLS